MLSIRIEPERSSMRQPLSFVSQGMIAGLILAVGAAAWVAREPVAAAVSGLFASGEETKGKRKGRRRKSGGSVPVVVQSVAQGRNNLVFAGIGTARALRHVTLYPAVSGEVVKVYTRAGDRVPAGAKIIELDVRQAQLAVAMASSKLKGVERMLARADRLRRKQVQSRAKVLDAKSLVDQAEVELKTANVALSDHTIKAPFAGVVGIAAIDVGDRVTPATQLVTLDDRSKLIVEFDVPEKYLPRLRSGTTVEVRTPGFANRSFRGILGGIDSRVHPTRRTVVVRAEVLNHHDMLRPGMSFAIDLKLPGEPFPQIPDLALQFNQRGNYVWLIGDGIAKRVRVKIVRRQSNTILVEGDLKPGDTIVIEGVQRLRPGRKVAVAGTNNKLDKDKSRGSTATVN
jgi:membrane fusion protein (multidrug efflux system)